MCDCARNDSHERQLLKEVEERMRCEHCDCYDVHEAFRQRGILLDELGEVVEATRCEGMAFVQSEVWQHQVQGLAFQLERLEACAPRQTATKRRNR